MSFSDRANHPPETWDPVRRAAAAITAPIQRILAIEAASGIVLLAATVAALVWANVWTASYDEFWHTPIGGRVGPWMVERPLHFWVNDGLMTVFFLVVGLEIRREIFEGELASLRKAALPLAAAVGGMLVPAILFATLNAGRDGSAGWAVPMATDIAFAIGILTLLGSRVSPALRVLLLALAVIDDIGAIIVIAVFYSAGIALEGIVFVGVGVAMVLTLRAAGVRAPLLYVAPGVVVWGGLLVSGVHPTIGPQRCQVIAHKLRRNSAPQPCDNAVANTFVQQRRNSRCDHSHADNGRLAMLNGHTRHSTPGSCLQRLPSQLFD